MDLAVKRVEEGVRQDGHDIEKAVIRRRFSAGLYNFEHFYRPIVDTWALYDNSESTPNLIKWGENL